jgi:S-formylglutathione hydrolase FrmB
MKAAFRGVILLAFLCAGVAGCGHRGPVLVDRPRPFPGVRMQDVTFWSASLKRSMPYRVYLPAQMKAGAKLPVVYLLHGGNGGFRDWSNYSEVGAYAARGYVLVMPEGSFSYWVNAAGAPQHRYGDYLTRDLPADVNARFPVADDRGHRAVIGNSMGGYAAIKMALTRPDLFAFAGAISPAVKAPSQAFSWKRWGQSMRLRRTFGPQGSNERRASDPFVLVKKADSTKTPYLYVTAGDSEPLNAPIRSFVALLKQRGFAYEFHTKQGGHDWGEWDAQVPGCFEQLMRHVPAG